MVLRIESIIFVLLSVALVLTAGHDGKEDGEREREAHSDRQGLWFGPRLGKRAPAASDADVDTDRQDDREVYLRLLDAADAVHYYYSQLPRGLLERSDPDARVTKKVIFTPKLGRSVEPPRALAEFTPRLGRQLDEEVPLAQQYDSSRGEEAGGGWGGHRARFFSPRLGRTMSFSPRLGRELAYDEFPARMRVARSVRRENMTASAHTQH